MTLTPYEKLVEGQRVVDDLGTSYTVAGVGTEIDPHGRGFSRRPLVTFTRDRDGVSKIIRREGYMLNVTRPDAQPEPPARDPVHSSANPKSKIILKGR